MLELRPLYAEVDQLRLCSIELRFGLRDIQIGRYAARETVLGERQIFVIRFRRSIEQIDVAIGSVELKVVRSQLRLIQQLGVFQVGEGGLRSCGGGRYAAADIAP